MGIIRFLGYTGIGSSSKPSSGSSSMVIWVFYVFFLISWSYSSVVSYRVVLCDITRQVFLSLLLEYVDTILSYFVAYSIKSHRTTVLQLWWGSPHGCCLLEDFKQSSHFCFSGWCHEVSNDTVFHMYWIVLGGYFYYRYVISGFWAEKEYPPDLMRVYGYEM